MIKSIRFKFGPTPDAAPIQITPGPMTVIVGPNNSGKSLTLQELNHSLYNADNTWDQPGWKILADLEPGLPARGEIRERVLEAIGIDFVRRFTAMVQNMQDPGTRMMDEIEDEKDIKNCIRQAQELITQKKLRPPATVSPSTLRSPIPPLATWFSKGVPRAFRSLGSENLGLVELIYAIAGRDAGALVNDGFIDFRGYYRLFKEQCMLLDGRARLDLAQGESCGSLHDAPRGTIMRLWHARQDLERLRALVFDAFGVHLCIDIQNLGSARLVLSEQPPPPNIEDRLDAAARRFITAARPLSRFSDGVRTYIGLHAELIAQDRHFVMIDEPEAFLHPPLARRLGFNLSTLAAERGSCVFAATHSPDFLMGCVESGVDVNIVRLGYRNGVATAHLLPRDELKTMMVDPLLRSTGILGALFHQAAVVVEGDSDRTFYNEITERLRIHEPKTHPAALRDCVFLNAQGKATVSRILAALRRLGVTSCGIIDLDLLKDSGICKNLFEAAGATESVCNSIVYTRSQIATGIGSKLAELCKPNGLDHASTTDRESVQHFIHQMAAFGIFLPEVGTVEGWLAKLGVKAHKNAWIPAIFEKMGPVHTGLKPAPGDVWEFIRRIGRYLEAQGAPHSPT